MNLKNTVVAFVIVSFAGIANARVYTHIANIENFGAVAENVIDHDFTLGAIASVDSVVIDLAHSWASDIELFLTAPDGSVFTLVNDNGFGSNLGDGGSLLGGVATYTFVAGGTGKSWDDFIAHGMIIPSDTYDSQTWHTGPFAAGTWNLTLNDDANGDDGAVASIVVNYIIPAPGSLAILCLGGLALARRRRA